MLLMLGCVSDALMLQPAAPRVLAPARHVVHGSKPQMLLPMVSLAEAGEAVAMKEVPYGLIAAGCVLTTLTAGFPMCATCQPLLRHAPCHYTAHSPVCREMPQPNPTPTPNPNKLWHFG